MKNKLSFEKLVDWVEGRLSAPEAEEVGAQIATDAALQAEVAWIRTFHQAADQTVFEAPPPEVRATLSRHFADYAVENRPPNLWERIVATLKFDSQMQTIPAGIRATMLAMERQLVYQTAFADVALTIQLSTPHKKFTVIGQVLVANGPLSEVFSVQLFQEGAEKAFGVTDEGGEFVFEDIPGGLYELAIHSDRHEFVILVTLTV